MIVLLRIILNISTRPKYKRYKKINRKPSGHKKITKKIISNYVKMQYLLFVFPDVEM